jgi:RNase P protein component
MLPRLSNGWDVLVVARSGSENASFDRLTDAIERCLARSGALTVTPTQHREPSKGDSPEQAAPC